MDNTFFYLLHTVAEDLQASTSIKPTAETVSHITTAAAFCKDIMQSIPPTHRYLTLLQSTIDELIKRKERKAAVSQYYYDVRHVLLLQFRFGITFNNFSYSFFYGGGNSYWKEDINTICKLLPDSMRDILDINELVMMGNEGLKVLNTDISLLKDILKYDADYHKIYVERYQEKLSRIDFLHTE